MVETKEKCLSNTCKETMHVNGGCVSVSGFLAGFVPHLGMSSLQPNGVSVMIAVTENAVLPKC